MNDIYQNNYLPIFITRCALKQLWGEYCCVEDSKGPKEICPICNCELNNDNKWKLDCDHSFCVHCLDKWSHNKIEWNCPICRAVQK
jgi:hypothetical protein